MRKTISILFALALVLSFSLVATTPVAAAPPVTIGLVLYLDADAIAGLNDDDPVPLWADLSGQGNDATQAIAANQPAYKAGILNGKPVVRFDGVDDFLDTNNVAFDFTAESFTVLMVLRVDGIGAAGKNRIIGNAGNLVHGWEIALNQANTAVEFLTHQAGTRQITASNPVNQDQWYSTTVVRSAADAVIYIDGTDDTVLAGTHIDPATSATNLRIGAYAFGPGGGFDFDGDIAEILIYNRALSNAERQEVEQYLGIKWLGWPSPAPAVVGWDSSPVNKAGVIAPWIALLAALMAGASLLVLRRRAQI